MRAWVAVLAAFVIALPAHAQKTISFPTEDSGVIFADLYGHGDNSVVLAHGGQFNKESWAPQARTLAAAGFLVPATDHAVRAAHAGLDMINALPHSEAIR